MVPSRTEPYTTPYKTDSKHISTTIYLSHSQPLRPASSLFTITVAVNTSYQGLKHSMAERFSSASTCHRVKGGVSIIGELHHAIKKGAPCLAAHAC